MAEDRSVGTDPTATVSEKEPWWSIKGTGWVRLVVALWVLGALVVFVRTALRPDHDVISTEWKAGAAWAHGKPVYDGQGGFIYPPSIAAFDALFIGIPKWFKGDIWRLVRTGTMLVATFVWVRSGLQPKLDRKQLTVIYLLLFPLAIGNLNNGQSNSMISGLLMLGVVAVSHRSWNLAALCFALPACYKVYPLAVGLLMCVLFPRELAWRIVLLLVLVAAAAFLTQHPAYVADQYRLWVETRHSDQRRYTVTDPQRDLWMIFRVAGVPLTGWLYLCAQLGSAAALAGFAWWAQHKHWDQGRLLFALLNLGLCWMLLLGPATEAATYVMLAPSFVFSVLLALEQPWSLRALAWSAYGLMLVGEFHSALIHSKQFLWPLAIQPTAALLFAAYCILLTARASEWERKVDERASGRNGETANI
jgi:Glycosyltransferase family 87